MAFQNSGKPWCRLPGLSGLVPPAAPQATAPDGEISSLRPRKPRLPMAWPASLIPSMTRLSGRRTSRCPDNCRLNLNLWQSVQRASLSYVATLRFSPLASLAHHPVLTNLQLPPWLQPAAARFVCTTSNLSQYTHLKQRLSALCA